MIMQFCFLKKYNAEVHLNMEEKLQCYQHKAVKYNAAQSMCDTQVTIPHENGKWQVLSLQGHKLESNTNCKATMRQFCFLKACMMQKQ